MKLTEFLEADVCEVKATIVNNKIHVNIMGTVRGGATVEKAMKAAIQALRERKSQYGYFPCYIVDLDGQGTRIYVAEE